jgi:hypothetical protein
MNASQRCLLPPYKLLDAPGVWAVIGGVAKLEYIYSAAIWWWTNAQTDDDYDSNFWHADWASTSIGVADHTRDDDALVDEPFWYGDTAEPHHVLVVRHDIVQSHLYILGLTPTPVTTTEARTGKRQVVSLTQLVHKFSENSSYHPSTSLSEEPSNIPLEESIDIAPLTIALARLSEAAVKVPCPTHMWPLPSTLLSEGTIFDAIYPAVQTPTLRASFMTSLVAHAVAFPKFVPTAFLAYSLITDATARLSDMRGSALVYDLLRGRSGLSTLGTLVNAYYPVYSSARDSLTFYRLADAQAIECDTALGRALIRTLADSGHRNGIPDRADFVFAMHPASLTMMRAAARCVSCATDGGQCRATRLLVLDDAAYLSASDVQVVLMKLAQSTMESALFAVATEVPECVGIGALTDCTCGVIRGADKCDCCAAQIAESSVASGKIKFKDAFGPLTSTFVFGRRGCIMRAAITTACTRIERALVPPNKFKSETGLRRNTQSVATASLLPGRAELINAGFDIFTALFPALPPCIAEPVMNYVRAAHGYAHPSYPERLHILSFLTQLSGMKEDPETLLNVWHPFFLNHEDEKVRAELTGRAGFEKSKYAKIAKVDAIKCAEAGRIWGCPSAVAKKVCPFSTGSTSLESCQSACSALLSSRIGRPIHIGSPIGFYKILWNYQAKPQK